MSYKLAYLKIDNNKKFLLGNIKIVIAFFLGIVLSGTMVYAATTLLSQFVYYNNISKA